MDVITDGLLITGALFAGAYCWVLSSRVQALKSLDSGLGAAIVTLTRQIELARATLEEARAASRDTRHDLVQLAARADAAAAQLRLLLAAVEKAEPAGRSDAPPAAAPPTATPAEPTPFEAALIARRREAAGPRLVSPAPEPEAAPALEPRRDARRDARLDARPDAMTEPRPEARPPAQAESSEPAGGFDPADAVPKPRRPLSLDALTRRAPPAEAPQSRDEAALIAALRAIASGGER